MIDRPQDRVVDHIDSRNSHSFEPTFTFPDPPDAYRVSFLDQTNDYETAERLVPWPGHVGPVNLTEELRLPGKTDPDEIWRETRRRQYELDHRTEFVNVVQEGITRSATRGDLVMGSFNILQNTDAVYEVLAVNDQSISLGGTVVLDESIQYGVRFFRIGDGDATTDASIIRLVGNPAGETEILSLSGDGVMPDVGSSIHLGPSGNESQKLYIHKIEQGEAGSQVISMIEAAPEIDELTDLEIPPPWDGRVGEIVVLPNTPPAAPIISLLRVVGDPVTLEPIVEVSFTAGSGSTVAPATYTLYHRLTGETDFVDQTVAAGSGSFEITGYSVGDNIELEGRATALGGLQSDPFATIDYTIEAPLLPPSAPPSGSVEGGLGFATFNFATPPEEFQTLKIYRSSTEFEADAEPIAELGGLLSNTSVTHIYGDATVTQLVDEPDFNAVATWSPGTDWSIDAGKAVKTPGSATELEQLIAGLVAGELYRGEVTVTRNAGSLTVRLQGASNASESPFITTGHKLISITAPDVPTTLSMLCDSSFDGDVTGVRLYRPTSGSRPQGEFHFFISAVSDEGVESPLLALGPATIV